MPQLAWPGTLAQVAEKLQPTGRVGVTDAVPGVDT
jgi:hypothetical protein